MKFKVDIGDPKHLANVEAALKILDPAAEITKQDFDFRLAIEYTPDFFVRISSPDLPAGEEVWEYRDDDIFDERYDNTDRSQRLKELIRLGVITLLGKHFHLNPRWGILRAVRPTKIFHHLRDRGFSGAEIRNKLLTIYKLAPASVELLIEIGSKQENYFKSSNTIGIYVGIPFCPSRCRYCSFPAVSLETHQHLVGSFLEALYLEIKATGELIRESGFLVETIYVGGGTPTSLALESFIQVIAALNKYFKSEHTVEFTVEAGRPETISVAKLQAMKKFGVTRVCVNPQTMHQPTLVRMDRKHSIAQVFDAVQMVRHFPAFSLNMDLILGLPGETGDIFLQSLQKVLTLAPDSITIHTLAPKRAAIWRKHFEALELARATDIQVASEKALAILDQKNYYPYYLYRQRSILADQANIGFAKPGQESIYNIQMMEERQTILGLGGGAVSKWVTGPEHHVIREQNPKCPATYRNLVQEQIVKKAQQTRILLG